MAHWPLPLTEQQKRQLKAHCDQHPSLMVFPTETFYALGCKADDEKAVEKIYHLKKREASAPLLVLVDDWERLYRWAEFSSLEEESVAKQHWPGALTLILKVKPGLAKSLNKAGNDLAFRMTSNPLARDLIGLFEVPLVGTSANLSGASPQRELAPLKVAWGNEIDFWLDGGQTPGGQPSTLAKWSKGAWQILRQGAVQL